MRLGFVGSGAITEALVVGLLRTPAQGLSVTVSPRNAETAARLAERFPGIVRIAPDNQGVVDACDTVVLAVRPQIAREVVPALAFREGQTVVSLVAMLAIADLAPMVAPARRVLRAVPLPSAAEGLSPTVLMPPDPSVRSLFQRVGDVVEVSDPDAFDALAAASAIMATHFAMAAAVSSWLEYEGVGAPQARAYVGRVLSGLARTADEAPSTGFSDLVRHHETPGGLNEQLRTHMAESGAFAAVREGLGALHRRIRNGG